MRKLLPVLIFGACIYPLNVIGSTSNGEHMSGFPIITLIDFLMGSLVFGWLKWLIIKNAFQRPFDLGRVFMYNILSFLVSHIIAIYVSIRFDFNLNTERIYFSENFSLYLLYYFLIIFTVSSLIEFPLYYLLMNKREREYKIALKYSVTANVIVYTLSYFLYCKIH